jgi:hypothetical protein
MNVLKGKASKILALKGKAALGRPKVCSAPM